jgi:hypothetical protein
LARGKIREIAFRGEMPWFNQGQLVSGERIRRTHEYQRSNRRHVDPDPQCAERVQKPLVTMPSSKVKVAIAKVLQDEGYIENFEVKGEAAKPVLHIGLKYYAGRPVIERIDRVSTPSLRIYKGRHDIPEVMNGLRHCNYLNPSRRNDRPQSTCNRRGWRSYLLRSLRREICPA